MRICYVINSLDGGAAFPLPAIAGVLRTAGYDVVVVALMERDGRARAGLEASDIPYVVIGGATRRYAATALRLAAVVRAMRPDVIWTSLSHATVSGQIVGRLTGTPVVSWLHNAWLKPINAVIMKRTAGLTRHWVADSSAVARFGQETLGIPADRMSVWPIFRADTAWAPARAPRNGHFVIGSLGRLHNNKGYDVLLRAMALLERRNPQAARAAIVQLAGEGPERANLERLARELGLANVVFCGFAEPLGFLQGLACYVQPSHHEGFCIAAHEAMVAGLPIIASPVGEMAKSIAAAGGGTLVDYGDAAKLSRVIEGYIRDPSRAAREGEKARAWVLEEFSAVSFRTRGLAAIAEAGFSVEATETDE